MKMYNEMSKEELADLIAELKKTYKKFQDMDLHLDLQHRGCAAVDRLHNRRLRFRPCRAIRISHRLGIPRSCLSFPYVPVKGK